MRTLPPSRACLAAWREGLADKFARIPAEPGHHDEALLNPTRPPGHCAFSRLRFLLTLDSILSLPGDDIFDIAAGACFFAAALKARGKSVTVNDLQPTKPALSVWRLEEEVRHYTRDAFDLDPEETGLFDVVLCAEIIEHVAHPSRLLAHAKRFLRPGGHLVVTTPNGSFLGNRLPTLSEVENPEELERRQYRPDSDGHLMLMTPGELRGLLEGAGFSVEETLLFGSPAISGNLKFRHLSWLGLPSFWYRIESLAHAAPAAIRAKLLAHTLMIGRAAR